MMKYEILCSLLESVRDDYCYRTAHAPLLNFVINREWWKEIVITYPGCIVMHKPCHFLAPFVEFRGAYGRYDHRCPGIFLRVVGNADDLPKAFLLSIT